MAVRIRKDGRILCAAMHPAEPDDIYVDDAIHYHLSVVAGVLVTQLHEEHQKCGEWWWLNKVPQNIVIDTYYGQHFTRRLLSLAKLVMRRQGANNV